MNKHQYSIELEQFNIILQKSTSIGLTLEEDIPKEVSSANPPFKDFHTFLALKFFST
jgi:hypothetical protein